MRRGRTLRDLQDPGDAPAAGRRRRGFTLIEMLTVMVLISTMLGLGSVVIHRLVRAERAGRAALDESAAVARMADQFRRDAHAAIEVQDDPEGSEVPDALRFMMPGGGVVEYRTDDGALTRIRHDADTDAPEEGGEPAGPLQDSLRASGHGAPGLALIDDHGATLAVLRFGDPEGARVRDLRVEAVVGFDHRHEANGGGR